MLLSRKLLNALFPIFNKVSNQELETMLNSIGVEVENIIKYEKTENLIVGEIRKVEKHPNADKLNICEVFFENKTHVIICGAQNVRPGLKVIVAKVGTKMLDGRLIEAKDLLGVKSNGMICAYAELTTRTDVCSYDEIENIIELDNDAKLNDTDPLKYIGLDDEILDLSTPSNRNELNGVIPIAYDLISLYFPKSKIDFSLKNIENQKKNSIKINLDKDICKFFGVIDVNNIEIKPSSWKVKSFLLNCGITPINTIVDITNLNTIITSNPCHAYDRDKLGKEMIVSLNNHKEKFLALNDKEYLVENKSTVSIISNNKVVSLASIIGSKENSISSNTKNVLFEIGNFNNMCVRDASNKLGIKTSASTIGSRKIPLWITYKSFDYLIGLLKDLNIKVDSINYVGDKLKDNLIDFDNQTIQDLLGQKTDVEKNLKLMGFNFIGKKVKVPIYREDIENISDLVEELTKKINVNNLELKPIESSFVDFEFDNFEENWNFLEKYFINKGFTLVKTLNLTSLENNKAFNLFGSKKSIKIINPISSEREYFRNNLIQQHLEVLSNNYTRKINLYNIFEIQGLNYDGVWNKHLCLTLPIEHFNNKINNSKIVIDLLFIKSIVTDLFKVFNISFEIKAIENLSNDIEFISINNGFQIYLKDKLIGIASQVSPEVLNKYKLDSSKPIYFVELIINDLLDSKISKLITVSDEKKEHNIIRSITLSLDRSQSYKKIESVFTNYKNNLNLLDKFEIESVFIKDNKPSYTFELEINANKLNKKETSEINEIVEKLIKDLIKEGAEIKR